MVGTWLVLLELAQLKACRRTFIISFPRSDGALRDPNCRTPASCIFPDGVSHVYSIKPDLPVPFTKERCGPKADGSPVQVSSHSHLVTGEMGHYQNSY